MVVLSASTHEIGCPNRIPRRMMSICMTADRHLKVRWGKEGVWVVLIQVRQPCHEASSSCNNSVSERSRSSRRDGGINGSLVEGARITGSFSTQTKPIIVTLVVQVRFGSILSMMLTRLLRWRTSAHISSGSGLDASQVSPVSYSMIYYLMIYPAQVDPFVRPLRNGHMVCICVCMTSNIYADARHALAPG